jgi:hypothetical protein
MAATPSHPPCAHTTAVSLVRPGSCPGLAGMQVSPHYLQEVEMEKLFDTPLSHSEVPDEASIGLVGRDDLVTRGTAPDSSDFKPKNAFDLADIEALLTDKVWDILSRLAYFRTWLVGISKEIPVSTDFAKLVAGFIKRMSLQFSVSYGQGIVSFDQVGNLQLQSDGFFTEIVLDGKKFLLVPLSDGNTEQVPERRN